MRQQSLAAHARCRRRSLALALVAVLVLPLLLACGLSDIFGKKATATVPAALLETPVKTATPAPATATATATTEPTATQATSGEAAASQPTATVAPTAAPAASPAAATGQSTYTVVQGDTLSGIAQTFGLTTQELVAANSGIDPNALSIGQTIIIPIAGALVGGTPIAIPTQGQGDGMTAGDQAAYAQAIQFDALSGWFESLMPLVTTLAISPSSMCTSPEFDSMLQQGLGLQVNLGTVTPPPEMAALQAELQAGMQGINDGLAAAKAAMCETNDSAAAITSLLQVSMSLGQVQATLDSIGQSIQQGVGG